jgi:N6-L-threonylcarbamoyladenine synthase
MKKKDIWILAIESSCDDTSAAVLCNRNVLSNVIASQEVHRLYGGVVPELASRAHQLNIIPVIDTALKNAGIEKEMLNAVAFTRGPGLLGSLLVGVSFAKTLALGLGIPLIETDHMKAHILAHFIENDSRKFPPFPFLCLTVSGGHTQIVKVDNYKHMHILGQTIDDAAGEAFDKAAKILGLPYPGGPLVDKHAKAGNPLAFRFSEPVIEGLNFSYSGLKTSFLYLVRDNLRLNPGFIEEKLEDLCASIQHAIVNILVNKLLKAVEITGITHVAIAGGVSANSGLREAMLNLEHENKLTAYLPKFEYSTDNAAMIGINAYFKFLENDFCSLNTSPYTRQN